MWLSSFFILGIIAIVLKYLAPHWVHEPDLSQAVKLFTPEVLSGLAYKNAQSFVERVWA